MTGVGRALRAKKADIQVYALEPSESPVLKEGKKGKHKIQGISAGFVPSILDTKLYDDVLEVPSKKARQDYRIASVRNNRSSQPVP